MAARGFALVTCMDSRIEPLTMLGLHPGDAKILRNAGGRVTPDVLRSLVLATRFLGVTEVAVMQHTNCALADQTDDDVRTRLGAEGTHGVEEWEFLAMPDPDGALRTDVAVLRNCPQLPDDRAHRGMAVRRRHRARPAHRTLLTLLTVRAAPTAASGMPASI